MDSFHMDELGFQGLNQRVGQDRKLVPAKQRALVLPTQVTLTLSRLLYKLKLYNHN